MNKSSKSKSMNSLQGGTVEPPKCYSLQNGTVEPPKCYSLQNGTVEPPKWYSTTSNGTPSKVVQ